MNLNKQRGLSLIAISVIFMLLGLVAMGFLYTIRYGHLPMQDVWARWGKSANVIGSELKNASGVKDLSLPVLPDDDKRRIVTVESGARKCIVHGKTVYSDTECTDSNPTSKNVKLHDTQGFVRPAVQADEHVASGSAEEMHLQMLDKAIQKAQK
ncbi:hypothetical protein [Undibacterium oligocarboniphilum]|uniref:DUF4124 domain-containing protein n=1 Tax=Undibacterium oligocarboniphilum TaxID=666702 RepID=A0A850QMD6_9BURK|nr:hypothetical protein [Undibacterium oligocarboniphilum]MBC3870645.1 hypothetical protein [Undibacterium oligocarboniphilum]NVO78553.1 hypothetical protein [Undibacterium oligocarboniphilum]